MKCPGIEKCEFPPCDHGCYLERHPEITSDKEDTSMYSLIVIINAGSGYGFVREIPGFTSLQQAEKAKQAAIKEHPGNTCVKVIVVAK